MPQFSQRSQANLDTCDERLQEILNEAIGHVNFTVIEGFRGKERQQKMLERGTSELGWPESKHNKNPSMAVDIIPYPFQGWDHKEGFAYLAGWIMCIAKNKCIRIRWGGDWDEDGIVIVDQNFDDLPHFELMEE